MKLSASPRWGIIGFGEVGSTFAHHLGSQSSHPITVTDVLLQQAPLPDHMRNRLASAAVEVAPDIAGLVSHCDVVLSVVTPGAAASVASLAGRAMQNGLFIDFNSVSPLEKKDMSALFDGESYVDGSILGSVSGEGARALLALAGPRSQQAHAWLSGACFHSSSVGSQVGAASAMKMCRSIFMKGLECLVIETLLAAAQFNLRDRVLESIEGTISSYGVEPLVKMLVTTHAAHCGRRADEMQRAVDMLTALGLPSHMSEAARDLLQASSDTGLPARFNHQVPEAQDEVIRFLSRYYRQTTNGNVKG